MTSVIKTKKTTVAHSDGWDYEVFLDDVGCLVIQYREITRDGEKVNRDRINIPFKETANALVEAIREGSQELPWEGSVS